MGLTSCASSPALGRVRKPAAPRLRPQWRRYCYLKNKENTLTGFVYKTKLDSSVILSQQGIHLGISYIMFKLYFWGMEVVLFVYSTSIA